MISRREAIETIALGGAGLTFGALTEVYGDLLRAAGAARLPAARAWRVAGTALVSSLNGPRLNTANVEKQIADMAAEQKRLARAHNSPPLAHLPSELTIPSNHYHRRAAGLWAIGGAIPATSVGEAQFDARQFARIANQAHVDADAVHLRMPRLKSVRQRPVRR